MGINTNSAAVTGPLLEARSSVPIEMSPPASSDQVPFSLIGPLVVGRSSLWTSGSSVSRAMSFVASMEMTSRSSVSTVISFAEYVLY